MSPFAPSRLVAEIARRNGTNHSAERQIAEETAIALSYAGSTYAVMMATPGDLEDFAMGFSMSEGIITGPGDIESIDIVAVDGGIDLQISLKEEVNAALIRRKRAIVGPVGCGLCGVESIEEALRPAADVSKVALTLSAETIADAVRSLTANQSLNAITRATHAAGFYIPDLGQGQGQGQGLMAWREDVGRHNALDKLFGHLVRNNISGTTGCVVITSRLSVELVQKTARLGASVLLAVSAPTGLAIDMAVKAGMTLVALVRGDDFEIFSGFDRIKL